MERISLTQARKKKEFSRIGRKKSYGYLQTGPTCYTSEKGKDGFDRITYYID